MKHAKTGSTSSQGHARERFQLDARVQAFIVTAMSAARR
jgi:hypothetical protein